MEEWETGLHQDQLGKARCVAWRRKHSEAREGIQTLSENFKCCLCRTL